MSFEFVTDDDEKFHITMSSLIRNDGFYLSLAQKNFMNRRLVVQSEDSQCYGTPVVAGQRVAIVEAIIRHADYGYRSVRRHEIVYVLDDNGIIESRKLKFKYSADGKSSQVIGYDVTFTRDPLLSAPESLFVPPVTTDDAYRKIIAGIGAKVNLTAKIIAIRQFNTTPIARWDTGVKFKTILKTDDNALIVYWGYLKNSENPENAFKAGDRVVLKASLKSVNEYQGNLENIVQRPKAVLA